MKAGIEVEPLLLSGVPPQGASDHSSIAIL